jgi:ribosomal protein L16/L10AE
VAETTDASAAAGVEVPGPIIFQLRTDSDCTPFVEEACKKAKQNLNTVSKVQGREEFAETHI